METGKINRRTGILIGQAQCTKERRAAARCIDLIVLAVIFLIGKFFWLPLGWMGAMAYAGIQDFLGQGQSIGKRIIGLQVIEDDTAQIVAQRKPKKTSNEQITESRKR